MIEKFFRDFKDDFEAALWGRKMQKKLPADFTLQELNEWVTAYTEEVNMRRHPVLSGERRWDLFAPAVSTCEYPPDHARMYFTGQLMRTVQSGLLQGKNRHDWFVAPMDVANGERVEIILSGKECYLFRNGAMEKLKPQSGSLREMISEETGAELYGDYLLRQRLAEELDMQSGGAVTMRSLPEEFNDDIAEFYEKPRSADEIKNKAAYFIGAVRVNSSANIIPFQNMT